MSTALTPALRDQHEQDEAVIAKGIATFREVGEALQRIRDCRTYLQTHESFEDYLRERWDMKRAHAFRLIDAAETVKTLSPIGDRAITNEATARAVAKIEPSVRVEVVEKAVAHAKSEGPAKHRHGTARRGNASAPRTGRFFMGTASHGKSMLGSARLGLAPSLFRCAQHRDNFHGVACHGAAMRALARHGKSGPGNTSDPRHGSPIS